MENVKTYIEILKRNEAQQVTAAPTSVPALDLPGLKAATGPDAARITALKREYNSVLKTLEVASKKHKGARGEAKKKWSSARDGARARLAELANEIGPMTNEQQRFGFAEVRHAE